MLDLKNIDLKYRPKIRYWIPGGMIREDDIRKDVRDFYERGFGSIEVVSFTLFGIKTPEGYAWGDEPYIRGLIALLDEASKLGMKVDIANGPAWPIAMPDIPGSDSIGTSYEITFGIGNNNELPERTTIREEGTSHLIALYMYKEVENHVLDETTYINLLPYLEGNHINYEIPENYLVFAFYEQPSTQKVNGMYVIDHLSKDGTKWCEKFWINKLYPRIKQYQDTLENIFCDSLEYKVAQEWTRGMKDLFINKYHYDILPYMCCIGTDLTYPKNVIPNYHFKDQALETKTNRDYFALISDLYANEHLQSLEDLANQMGMHVRYQVAYNKPFEISQAAIHVGIPENEALSRCSIDNLKTMAGAVHLSHKMLHSYECSAEFENAYGQTFEDILWWIKRSYVGGMNFQVFHGGTYNGGYDGPENIDGHLPNASSPGFEAFGKFCSNYWNRTLDKKSEYEHLQTIARYNYILQKQHKVDIAFYRNEYLNNGKGGDGRHVVKDDCLLFRNGYDYDFISYECLKEIHVINHQLDPEGIAYKALVLLPDTILNDAELAKLTKLAKEGLLVYTLNKQYPFTYCKDYNELLNYFSLLERSIHYHQENLIYHIHTVDKENEYYYFYNGNAVQFGLYEDINPKKAIFHPDTIYPTIKDVFEVRKLDVTIQSDLYPVLLNDDGSYSKLPFTREDGIHLQMILDQDEAIMICLVSQSDYEALDHYDTRHVSEQIIQTLDFERKCYQLVFDGYYMDEIHYELKDEIDAGYYEYTTSIEVAKGIYGLSFDHISDTYRLEVDGKVTYPISEYHPHVTLDLEEGKHTIQVTVYTNLQKMLVKDREYGILGNAYLTRKEI